MDFLSIQATRLVQVPPWSFLWKLVLGHVIFECKRHGDGGGDDENLVASPFSNLSKNCSYVSPYVVPVHVAVTDVFGSDFGSIEGRSGSSFLQGYVTRCLALCTLEVGTSAVSAKAKQ